MRGKWLIALTLLVLVLPYVVLIGAGWLWLYEHGWFWPWVAGAALFAGATWLLGQQMRKTLFTAAPPAVEPSAYWQAREKEAWQQVQVIADRIEREPLKIEKPEDGWKVLKEIIESVARVYHPKSEQPFLEVPATHLFQIVERVARDLRQATQEHVPGSHLVTINDFRRLGRLASWGSQLYNVYRVVSFGINPVSAILREFKDAATRGLMSQSAEEIQSWAVQFAIKRTGYYAIELYSGRLELDATTYAQYTSPVSARDQVVALSRDEKETSEPFRLLLLGQVKAGKSSLVNALFGDVTAGVDALPLTQGVNPYYLSEESGLPKAIILDTAGYADAAKPDDILRDSLPQVLQSDFVLLVSSVGTAAREPDRKLLNALRNYFQEHPDREFPPLLVALTHIDQVRPLREWEPPYNLETPDGPKAENIRAAVEAVAQDLELDVSQIVPVCLQPNRIYNIDESLIPAMWERMDQARRAKYLRCLKTVQAEGYWERIWEQTRGAGRLLTHAGLTAAASALRNADQVGRSWMQPRRTVPSAAPRSARPE